METLIRILHEEPILVSNGIKTLIGVLVAFGLISSGAPLVVAALTLFIGAVLTIAVAFIERSKVTPVRRSNEGIKR